MALVYAGTRKAAKLEKNIVFIFRYDQEKLETMKEIKRVYGFDVIFLSKLHSKIYMNERKVIITSMNLYDCSKELNFETGYLMDSKMASKKFLDQIVRGDLLSVKPDLFLKGRYYEIKKLEKADQMQKELDKQKRIEENNERKQEKKLQTGKLVYENGLGFCIRCSKRIPLHSYLTMCNECYQIWSMYGDPYYKENYCHKCGGKTNVNKENPICYSCFNGNQSHMTDPARKFC